MMVLEKWKREWRLNKIHIYKNESFLHVPNSFAVIKVLRMSKGHSNPNILKPELFRQIPPLRDISAPNSCIHFPKRVLIDWNISA